MLTTHHTNGPAADTKTPRERYSAVETELELIELEGLAVALKIVRYGDGVCTRIGESDHNLALLTMIDAVLAQVGKLSEAMRGHPMEALITGGPPSAEAGEDAKPLWAKNSTRTGQLMELMGDVTDEDLDKANSEDLNCISELCLAMDRRIDATSGARHRAKRAMAEAD